MAQTEIDLSGISFDDIDLTDPKPFADGVPHHWFAFLRKNAPVWWQEEADGPGFWAVTTHADCTEVNRDYEHFSSARKATYIWDLADDDLAQQQMLMLNMDPPLHTRYRRLVNKGFTPRMVNQLHDRINAAADNIIDSVIETGQGRLRHRHRRRAAPGGDRRTARRSPRGPPPHVRLVEPDDRQRGPRVPERARRRLPNRRPWSCTPTPPSCSPPSGPIPTTT